MSKLKWGLIGGGEGSQIGPAHRIGAALDGLYTFAAGALDVNPERGRAFAQNSASHPTAPMATGARCWRESATGPTVSTSLPSRRRTRHTTRSPGRFSKRGSRCCAKSQ